MGKIIQYRPAFVTGFENEMFEFETWEELQSIPFVANFRNAKSFYRYSLSESNLMAEYKDGYSWYVVGEILDAAECLSNLPKFAAKFTEEEIQKKSESKVNNLIIDSIDDECATFQFVVKSKKYDVNIREDFKISLPIFLNNIELEQEIKNFARRAKQNLNIYFQNKK